MKSVIFSTEDKNGAGGAAYRIHTSLKMQDIDSLMYIYDVPKHSDTFQIVDSLNGAFFKELNWMLYKEMSKDMSLFSVYYPITTNGILKQICNDAEIINIHWVNGLLSTENITFLCNLGKPVVITMHDERMYTGGCHYRNGCKGYLTECTKCNAINDVGFPHFLYNQQKSVFNSNVTFVSPSRWLANVIKTSPITKNNNVVVIQNGHDTKIFRPLNREQMRLKYGIQKEEFVILCGAQNLNDSRKGFDLLQKSLERLMNSKINRNIRLISFGIMEDSIAKKTNSISFGYIGDEEKLTEIYNIADVLALPSREDNLPNIMIESLCCGTPVVSFAVGGVVDVIQDDKNGYLVEPFNVERFAEAIIKISQNENSMRRFCRNDAVRKYSLSVCGKAYKSLFKELTTNRFLKSYDIREILPFFTTYIEKYKDSKVSVAENLKAKMMIAHFEHNSNIVADICRRVIKQYKIGKKIIIFGYGFYGREVEKYMEGLIDFFVDNNSNSKKGKVRNPNVLKNVSKEEYTIIISVEKCDEICRQLEDMGYIKNANYFTV